MVELTAKTTEKKPEFSYRTIGEVSKELDLPTHVLRFWETKFKQIKPLKRKGGHRYYSPDDVVFIKEIKNLLHERGYTIKGAQKYLNEHERIVKEAIEAASAVSQQDLFSANANKENMENIQKALLSEEKKKALSDIFSEMKLVHQLIKKELSN